MSDPHALDALFESSFLKKLEEHYGTVLPMYLRHLLIATGFDNAETFGEINDEAINEMEIFGKTSLESYIRTIVPVVPQNRLKDIYHIYGSDPSQFKIVIGHRLMLKKVSDIYAKKATDSSVNNAIQCSRCDGCPAGKRAKLGASKQESEHPTVEAAISAVSESDVVNIVNCALTAAGIDTTSHVKGIDLQDSTVECVVCKKRIKLQVQVGSKNSRISAANFVRHMRTHNKSDEVKLNGRKVKQSLLTFNKLSTTNESNNQIQTTCSEAANTNINSCISYVLNDDSSSYAVVDDGAYQTHTTGDVDIVNDNDLNVGFPNDILFDSTTAELSGASSHMVMTPNKYNGKPYVDGISKLSKWKDAKYSVTERRKRKRLNIIDHNQPKINEVFEILNKLDAIANQNQVVSSEVTKAASNYMCMDKAAAVTPFESNKTFFRDMYSSFIHNQPLAKNGNRYSSDVKRFSAYMFVIGGRLLYETLSANLPLPSISTVLRVLHTDFPPIVEGQLRVKELKQFLLSKNAPLAVWLSEDGTRITSKVQYDARSNMLVGLVMPLDNITGFPKGKRFVVDSAKDIADHFASGKPSNYAYVIMAQAVVDNMPPFCLSMFGTDNAFKAEDVLNRWNTMQAALAAEGITVMGFSSDGDSRLMKAMRTKMIPANGELDDDLPKFWNKWFFTKFLPASICVQDTVHIGTKLRTRLLNVKDLIVMGDFVASVNHLTILLETKTKDVHHLKLTDLNGSDKMNFGAVQSISHERMESILTDVAGSEGTLVYLRIVRYVLQSFIDETIDVTDRIYKMWYAVFVLRLWKAWLTGNSNYRAENFITSNAYTCIELNAHGMINCVVKARDMSHDWSKIWLFNSQTCESFFRKARSQTSTYCTVINFSMLDFLHRAKRIQAQEDISRDLNKKYVFTRQSSRNAENSVQYFPSNDEINNIISKARCEAINTVHGLGMSTLIVDNTIPMIVHTHTHTTHDTNGGEPETNEENNFFGENVATDDTGVEFDLFLLQQFNDFECFTQLEAVSSKLAMQCLQFRNSAGKTFFVKKSTLCWLLNNNDKQHISSDRIRRFIVQNSNKEVQTAVNDKDRLKIGDWAEFANKDSVGQVIGFTYLTGSRKEREYTLDSVPINDSTGSGRGIGVLCNWFVVRPGFVLESASVEKHEYIDITLFKAHLFKPTIDNATMQLVLDERNTFSSE